MKLDVGMLTHDLKSIPSYARKVEALGFDCLWSSETQHDPYLPLAVAAGVTSRIKLGTSIAVVFPRSPMITAHIAWDLQKASEGRFVLGLGTQVKGHNERRFGVKWDKPVEKMREVILAVRAIWDCWQNKTRLNFQGEYFKLNLMTPFFSPEPHEYHRIPIFIAGVNRRMCQLGGELCEGFHVHPLHSARYIREVVLPNIEQGLAKAGRQRKDLELSSSLFVIPTDDPKEAARYESEVRQQISFYASTPPYRPVFDLEGWGGVADQLKGLAARGRWNEMPAVITDEMLDRLVLRGCWAELPGKVLNKYVGLLDRVSYYFPFEPGTNDVLWRDAIGTLSDKSPA